MEVTVDKTKELEEALDTTVSSSGRSRRKPKPKSYSSDFYTFDNHGKLLPPTAQTMEILATSTPVKQPGMGKQGRPKKQVSVESAQSDKSDISSVPAEVKRVSTSQIMLDASPSGTQNSHRNTSSDMLNASETNSQDGIAENGVIVQIAETNGQQSATEKATNNESKSETGASCSSGEKKVKRQPKKRKGDISGGDSLKENISKKRRSGSLGINSENRSMLGTDIAYGGSEVDMALKTAVEMSAKNSTGQETHRSPYSSGMSLFHRKQRERSVESTTPLTSSSSQCGEPAVPSPPNQLASGASGQIDLGRNSINNADPQEVPKESSEQQFDSCASSTPNKRPRGRPPKCISQESPVNKSMKTADSTEVDSQLLEIKEEIQHETGVTLLTPKRRGRPPRNVSQNSFTPSQEIKEEISCDNTVAALSVKRPGRPPKYVPQQMPVPPNTTAAGVVHVGDVAAASTPKKRRGRPPLSSVLARPPIVPKRVAAQPPSDKTPLMCRHCWLKMDKSSALKHHMMTEHSLMWSVENPEGEDNPTLVIKALGHIVCQRCNKKFRFAQYYRHHQIWCGREDERATCEICERSFRAMWMQQHLMTHRTQEKRARENEQKELLRQAKGESEEEEAEDESAGKRRRKAAKKAIKLMSSLIDDAEPERAKTGDSSAEVSSSGEDDDDDDGDNSDDEETSGAEKRKKKPRGKRMEKDSDSGTDNLTGARRHLWTKACVRIPRADVNKRLQLFKELYDQLPERPFPDLSPKEADWQRLTDSVAEKYLPERKESLKFAFGSAKKNKMEDGEHTLKFGHTLSHEGSSYCFTGGPIWAVEWCPVPQESSQSQFLAVCADRFTEEHLDGATLIDGPGLIQIWSTGPLANERNCCAAPVLQYAIAHEAGYNHGISWCPKVCFDNSTDDGYLKRLGLFAVACSDGSVLVFCPPQPEELKQENSSGAVDTAVPVFRPPPALRLVPNSRKGCGPCISVAWQQLGESNYILGGYGHGAVYLWNIALSSPFIRIESSTLIPIRCFSFHTSPVVSLAWNPVVPSVFVTVALDFHCCLWKVESPDHPFGIIKKQVHNMQRSVCWAGPICNGFFTTYEKLTGYDDTPVCFFGVSRAVLHSNYKYLNVQYHTACTWDICFSPYHEVIITCDALGIVRLTFLPVIDIMCRKAGKTSWHRTKSRAMDLYHIKLIPRSQPSSTQQQAAKDVCQHNSATENSQQSPTASSRNEGPDGDFNPDNAEGAGQDMLHFMNSEMKKEELKPVKSRCREKPKTDMFYGSNANAVHKVSLNRNPSCSLWLASGGQSGILRLDNLKRLG